MSINQENQNQELQAKEKSTEKNKLKSTCKCESKIKLRKTDRETEISKESMIASLQLRAGGDKGWCTTETSAYVKKVFCSSYSKTSAAF